MAMHSVLKKSLPFVAAAFGLVAALAWNDAIRTLFKRVFGEIGSLQAQFGYAIIVTLIAVIVISWLQRQK